MDGEDSSQSIDLKSPEQNSLMPLDQLRLENGPKENVILVLGSEGEGVSRTIARSADYRVVIPPQLRMDQLGKFPFDTIDSLNVGVTAAMLLYHIRHLMSRRVTQRRDPSDGLKF